MELITSFERDELDIHQCAYCNAYIKLMPCTVAGHMFCDIICARLWCHDAGLPADSQFDKMQYDIYVKSNLITNSARKYYTYLQRIPFDIIPVGVERMSKNEAKRNAVDAVESYIKMHLS